MKKDFLTYYLLFIRVKTKQKLKGTILTKNTGFFIIFNVLNPFLSNVSILYPLKTPEKHKCARDIKWEH